MIQVRDLRKAFGTTIAVDGVSFQIARGETFGLLGPNGAGKTRTIHMLVGVLRPDAGVVSIDGVSDPTRPEVRRTIGIAPQSLALYDQLTGQENLAFFGRLNGVSGADLRTRITWALEFAQLTEHSKRRAGAYSGGMKRRLNMACGLMQDPSVILLDEPTVAVDTQSRNHIFDRIEVLQAKDRTILYATHYMEEAQRLCDRVAVMDQGKILALGTVDTLIERHGGRSVVGGGAAVRTTPGRPAAAERCARGDITFRRARRVTSRGGYSKAGVPTRSMWLVFRQ